MAITYLGFDGFETGYQKPVSAYLSGFGVNTTEKTGVYGMGVSGTLRRPIPGAQNELSGGYWWYPSSTWTVGGNSSIAAAELSTGELVGVYWNPTTKTFDAYVDGVLVASGSVAVQYNDWFNVQFYIIISDTVGYIGCKIGGQLALDYSGNTLPAEADAEVSYFYYYNTASGGSSYMDDFVWGIGGWTGDCRVDYIKPNADTVVNDWTPSTAVDHYTTIDEVPPNITDYLYTSTTSMEEEVELEDWDGEGKTPVAVWAWCRAREDVATAESLQVGVDSGGVDDVTEYIMTDQYAYYGHYMDENPDGPAAWDEAAINALKFRLESII